MVHLHVGMCYSRPTTVYSVNGCISTLQTLAPHSLSPTSRVATRLPPRALRPALSCRHWPWRASACPVVPGSPRGARFAPWCPRMPSHALWCPIMPCGAPSCPAGRWLVPCTMPKHALWCPVMPVSVMPGTDLLHHLCHRCDPHRLLSSLSATGTARCRARVRAKTKRRKPRVVARTRTCENVALSQQAVTHHESVIWR